MIYSLPDLHISRAKALLSIFAKGRYRQACCLRDTGFFEEKVQAYRFCKQLSALIYNRVLCPVMQAAGAFARRYAGLESGIFFVYDYSDRPHFTPRAKCRPIRNMFDLRASCPQLSQRKGIVL